MLHEIYKFIHNYCFCPFILNLHASFDFSTTLLIHERLFTYVCYLPLKDLINSEWLKGTQHVQFSTLLC